MLVCNPPRATARRCGPCKVMLPKVVEMSEEFSSAKFVKFNCNASNKELGKELGIKVAPTFHLYKNSKKVRHAEAGM